LAQKAVGLPDEALKYSRADTLCDRAAKLNASLQHFFRYTAFTDDRFLNPLQAIPFADPFDMAQRK
jgi:hypothetical protein